MSRHAVISGAGIAGPALAHQLATRGWQTTIIERSSQRRDEGQNVDVRSAAFARYERFMRGPVDATPPVRMGVLRRVNPRTRIGIRALHNGARIAASPAGQAIIGLLGKRLVTVAADGVRLPDYAD